MYGWFGREFSEPPVRDSQQLLNVEFADEILWSSGAALVFSFVWIYGSTRRWMTRLLNRVGAATTHGREDIWDLTFSRLQADVEYVHVRDLERGMTYAGWVRAYSETGKLRELLLRDAIVWDKTGDSIEVPMLYLARKDSDVHMRRPSFLGHGLGENPMSKEVGGMVGSRRVQGAESAPTARRLGREAWRPGSGGARAGNGTWFCGCCAASRLMRSREKSVWSSIAWRRGRRGRWPVSSSV